MAKYKEPVPADADIFTVEEFKAMCKDGCFIDYDGMGEAAKDGKLQDPQYTWIYPSALEDIPADATHVVWYNR